MKPLKLEFEGINSFSEHTIIDFEALTKNGIFGIFGDTGSGKSTILDCINFALYGNVERSKVMTDIINYRAEVAKVKFVFNILSEGKRKTYTVERSIKKDKYGTHKATLYERDGESEVCIADKPSTVESSIIGILGVEAEDFRKCIALPQGEFSQFVKSAPRDRLSLIERLFSLAKYGDRLKEKIGAREKETEGAFQNVSGRLQAYENVSENALVEAYSGVNSKKALFEIKQREAKEITEKCEKLKALNEKRKELESARKNLSKMLAEKDGIDELRKAFSVLNVCRDVVALDGEKTSKLNDIRGAIEKLSGFERDFDNVSKEIETYEKKISECNFEESIAECVKLQALYASCRQTTEKLSSLNVKLNEKRKEYRKVEEDKRRLESDREVALKAFERAEKELSACSDKGAVSLNDELKAAVLKEEYSYSLDYFANLKTDLKVFKEDSPLYNFVSGEVENKVKEYSERVRAVKEFSLEAVNEQLENLKKQDRIREERQKTVNACNERLQKLNAEIAVKESELKASLKEGAEVKAQTEELNAQLREVFGENCADFNAVISANDEKLKRLKTQKDCFAANLEDSKKRRTELGISIEGTKATKKAWEEEAQKLSKKLEAMTEKSGCGCVESCKKLVARFDGLPDAEKTIKEFDYNLSALEKRVEELQKTDGISEVSDAVYEAAECEKSDICGGVTSLTGEIAVQIKECETLKERLKEKEEILKEFTRLNGERNLIARLKETTKNNKFMEFIANEYLYDISRLASNTLLKLKDGRYFLTYKDNNFFVGDNFDCGNLRGVNTLSGGETFLVSLSLALALSQTICAKSLKNIEFFFLDEGFGTLDSSLVDTVMNALEKLKSADFTIGIISHVDELKYRIDSKITVLKATESHGSTVSVSC